MHLFICRKPITSKKVNDTWIGLTKAKHNCPGNVNTQECLRSNWTWVDGTPYDYSTFHDWLGDGEPDSTERCARLTINGWMGRDCNTAFGYICEKGNYHICDFFSCVFV